jgi:hypothetical protein
MSMPNIPDINPEICLCLEDVINLLFSSIALQEIALSNLINAESEKLESVVNMNCKCYSIKEIICLNESVEKVISEISSIENLLITKLKYVCNIYDKCNFNNNDDCENNDLECKIDFNNCECNKYCKNASDILNKKCCNNSYYKNYNRISDIFNKIIGTRNKIL